MNRDYCHVEQCYSKSHPNSHARPLLEPPDPCIVMRTLMIKELVPQTTLFRPNAMTIHGRKAYTLTHLQI